MKTVSLMRALLASMVLTISVAGVYAEEIVVQNDSITDFGSAYIVGDFVAGEQGGARLTSPCDGTIVAVQVLWLEGTPGHPQSLEQAIHIYDGSGFPTPGAELEILEAPVMTPGYMNEFRYLDEAQQFPIDVPVSAGQHFYITLEFANDTDVGNGGPSVVRDTDGCQSQSNVLYGNIGAGWNWYNFCLLITGDLAVRAVIDCPDAAGACCYANGNCAVGVEQGDCESEFGAVWYEGVEDCGQITCEPRGACCRESGCLQLVDPDTCDAIGGVYAGDGADCGDDVCVPGACCFEDGHCEELFEFECQPQGGVFHGVGTSCDPNPCPQPLGACCFGEFCVANQTEEQCTSAAGEWAGADTDCADNNDNGVPDACESGCSNPGSSGSYCTADIINDDCIVDLSDLAALLSNYGMTVGATHADGDVEPEEGDGDVDLADLAALLAQYGDDCN